jgi:hypothetical protein
MISVQFGRTARNRSWFAPGLLALAGAVVLSLAPISGAAASPAAGSPGVVFSSGKATFRVGGHVWTMSISAGSQAAEIVAGTTHESDSWTFSSAPANLKVNASTGGATFDSHNSFAPVAFVKLKFTARSRRHESCLSGSEVVFSGSVSGSVTLVANHKGLKFRSAHAKFRSSSLIVDNSCKVRTVPLPCVNGTWSIGTTSVASGSAPGLPGRQTYQVAVFKTVKLGRPAGAFLGIDVFANTSKPVYNPTKKTLAVTGSRSGGISGSAVLKAAGPGTPGFMPCTLSGKRYRERLEFYVASFTSPKGGEFQARSLVVGRLKVARSGSSSSGAFFDIVSVKRT